MDNGIITEWITFISSFKKSGYYRRENGFIRLKVEETSMMFDSKEDIDLSKFPKEQSEIDHKLLMPNALEGDLAIMKSRMIQPNYEYGVITHPSTKNVLVVRNIHAFIPVIQWAKYNRAKYRGSLFKNKGEEE